MSTPMNPGHFSHYNPSPFNNQLSPAYNPDYGPQQKSIYNPSSPISNNKSDSSSPLNMGQASRHSPVSPYYSRSPCNKHSGSGPLNS